MNFLLLEQVRIYSLYAAVNFWLPCAQTELNHKDCHSASGEASPTVIYVQGKAISTPLKLGLFFMTLTISALRVFQSITVSYNEAWPC